MKEKLRTRAAQVVRQKVPAGVAALRGRRTRRNTKPLERQVARLRRRVAALEDEVQENRRLNRRIAELTDVVQELLLSGRQDDDEWRARLDRYDKGI